MMSAIAYLQKDMDIYQEKGQSMGSSFKLFAVRGIDIRIHITFPLILMWAAFQFGQMGGFTGALFGLVVILLLFVLVTLHELGHSFAALHYGVPVRQIVLLPIGGLAQLAHMPERPWHEFVVAIAGPAVNLVLAILMGGIAAVSGLTVTNPLGTYELTLPAIFSYMFVYNLVLLVFNLLPAFPMDGGRVLRSLLAMVLKYETATVIAVNVGRVVAFFLGLWSLMQGQFLLLLIVLFIFVAGSQELAMVRWRGRMRLLQNGGLGFTVRQALSSQFQALGPYDNLHQALMAQMGGQQADFPVADDGRYLGFVTEAGLLRAANMYGPDALIYAAMSPDVRPVTPQTDLLDVQRQMARLRVRALPVVEYGRLLGMITYRQIQEFLARAASWPPQDTPRMAGNV